MAANSDYADTFIHVFKTVIEECEELCQTFFASDRQYCTQLYEQNKDTLQFPRKKQSYSPHQCSILLAAGQIAEVHLHAHTIKLFLTEIDKIGFDAIKRTVLASPDGPQWKSVYDSNRSQFKCESLKKLWDAVVITRLLVSKFKGVEDIAKKISLSEDEIQHVNRSLQGLSLSLHPDSPHYYADNIKFWHKLAVFFKIEPKNKPSSPIHNHNESVSVSSLDSQSSPVNIPSNSDSQLSPILFTHSAPSGTNFFSSLMRTISDISLPSSDEISDEENIVGRDVIKRPLTPALSRK